MECDRFMETSLPSEQLDMSRMVCARLKNANLAAELTDAANDNQSTGFLRARSDAARDGGQVRGTLNDEVLRLINGAVWGRRVTSYSLFPLTNGVKL